MAKLLRLESRAGSREENEMMFRTRTRAAWAAALAFALAAGAAQAQKPSAQTRPPDQADRLLTEAVPTQAPPPVNDGEAYHRADDSEQTPEELRMTQALNDEIASRNQLAENQERADREAYELERARYQVMVDQATRDRLAYEAAAREADDARRRWEIEQARRATDGPAAGGGAVEA